MSMKDIVEQSNKRIEQGNILNDACKVSNAIVNHKKRIRAGIEGYDNLVKYQNAELSDYVLYYKTQQIALHESLGFDVQGELKIDEITPKIVGEALLSNIYAAFSHVYFVIESLAYAIENRKVDIQPSIPYNHNVLRGEDVWPLREVWP